MTTTSHPCLQAAALTHVGKRRTRNEDCIAFAGECLNAPMAEPRLILHRLTTAGVCVVADGMGGHPAGDVASRMVADRLNTDLADIACDQDALAGVLINANQMLFSEMERIPALYGMGTTVAGALVHAAGILVFNLGDSRVYRIRAGKLEQLSTDDTMQASGGFFGTRTTRVLSQCLGGFPSGEEIRPHVVNLPLDVGTELLICSDGLHDMLADDQIEACLAPDLTASVQALFEGAMREGGVDNISVIHARVTRTNHV
jgi:serine/threonine protein phosphatase PrpC